MRRCATILLALATLVIATGLVNPSLQPGDLLGRHRIVATLEVTAVDVDAKTMTLAVRDVCKGGLAAQTVAVRIDGDEPLEAASSLLMEGSIVVAFIGKTRAGQEDELMFYPGSGRWQAGRLEQSGDATRWVWDADLGLDLFGTFNGAPERLAQMMADARDNRVWFPSLPIANFPRALEVGRVEGGAQGVALHDLDGDGRPDVVACAPGGVRAWLQTAPLAFTDRTAELGLAGVAAPSVTVGDLDGDGDGDLLLGAQAYLAEGAAGARRFAKADLLPAAAAQDLKCAILGDLDGDGWADVLVSRRGRGLAAYRHPGAGGGAFADMTAAWGLDQPACGSDGDGFVAIGDLEGDGRAEILYAIRDGLLLRRGDDGRFAPVRHGLELDLGSSDEPGLGGTAAFGPLWTDDGRDLIVSNSVGVRLVALIDGRLRERTSYGNELTETSYRQLALVAEDLDADGTVDLFVASRDQLPCKLFTNRGHGSWMCPIKYRTGIIPDTAQEFGAWGVAAGDADGDGDAELLLGGIDGRILLLVNGALEERPLEAAQDAKAQERVLARSRVLSARLAGRGVIGAEATLTDAGGRVLTRRQVGGNPATGCRGTDTVDLAVREPGAVTLTVRWSDGATDTWPVDLSGPQRRVALDATRRAP